MTALCKFDYNKLAMALRKEIEEYGSLLRMLYQQQNCLLNSLKRATADVEEQLTANQLATADRSAMVHQLAENLKRKDLSLNELPSVVPSELHFLFKALVDEVISLRIRIKHKMQFQRRLLEEAQMTNQSVIQQVFPQSVLQDISSLNSYY